MFETAVSPFAISAEMEKLAFRAGSSQHGTKRRALTGSNCVASMRFGSSGVPYREINSPSDRSEILPLVLDGEDVRSDLKCPADEPQRCRLLLLIYTDFRSVVSAQDQRDMR